MKRISVLAASLAFSAAHAQYTSIDLSSYTDYDTVNQTQGNNYPVAGYAYTINDIPFVASSYGSYSNEGLIYLGPLAAEDSVDIAVDESGIKSIYTEINSAYGYAGTQPGEVTLLGSAGSITYDLIEGLNIRDHYYGDFTNTVESGIGGTVYWVNGVPIQVSPGNADSQYIGDVRNDIQGWTVPSYIGELLSVEVTYTNSYYGYGEPLVYGLTTSTNPLTTVSGNGAPSPGAILPFALGGIGALIRRRRS